MWHWVCTFYFFLRGMLTASCLSYGLLHRIPRPSTPPSGQASLSGADGYFGPDDVRRPSMQGSVSEGGGLAELSRRGS